MTRRIYVVLSLLLGVVLGVWAQRAVEVPVSPVRPAVVAVEPAADTVQPALQPAIGGRGLYLALLICPRGMAEDTAAHIRLSEYGSGRIVYKCNYNF